MVRLCVAVLAGAALTLPAVGRAGGEKKAEAGKGPVEAKLTARVNTYPLNLGGLTAEGFKKAVQEAHKSGKYPPAPAVDLVLELRNTSDKEVHIWTSGDPVVLALKLEGPGAMNVPLKALAFTLEFRLPKATALAPGKSVEIPIKSLSHGHRGVAARSYWTAPGEYTLTASYKTGIAPPPPGSKRAEDGFGLVTITSNPVKLTVESK
jgi:hypothetical protein